MKFLSLFKAKPAPKPLTPYQIAALELRAVGAQLDQFLDRGRAAAHKNLKEVAQGVWIHKDYRDLAHCLAELKTWIPT